MCCRQDQQTLVLASNRPALSLVLVDDGVGFARSALVYQLSVLDDGVTMSTVVHVNLSSGVCAVEELQGAVA